jgi:hypothetical protein
VTGFAETAWVDRSLKAVWDRIVAASPRPEWVPRLKGGRKFSLEEYGCGHFGCVFPTHDPAVVVKLTSDLSEAFFVAAALAIGEWPDGIVRYYAIYQVPDVERHKRPLFVLWREEATGIGDPVRPRWPEGPWLEPKDRYENKLRRAFAKNLQQYKNLTWPLTVMTKADPTKVFAKAARYGDWAWRYVEESYSVGRPINVSSFRGPQKAALLLAWVTRVVQDMMAEDLSYAVGEAILFYLEKGLLIADVHGSNVGFVPARMGDSTAVITDPGLVIPIVLPDVSIPRLP